MTAWEDLEKTWRQIIQSTPLGLGNALYRQVSGFQNHTDRCWRSLAKEDAVHLHVHLQCWKRPGCRPVNQLLHSRLFLSSSPTPHPGCSAFCSQGHNHMAYCPFSLHLHQERTFLRMWSHPSVAGGFSLSHWSPVDWFLSHLLVPATAYRTINHSEANIDIIA